MRECGTVRSPRLKKPNAVHRKHGQPTLFLLWPKHTVLLDMSFLSLWCCALIVVATCCLGTCFAAKPVGASDVGNLGSFDGNNTLVVGWVDGPNGRGSLDIIWSCLVTIFLCSWYSLCMNASALDDSAFDQYRDKMAMTLLSFLGPEFILLIAMGQYSSAQCSVKQFHASGHQKWTLRHAFYADMGGFNLKCPDFAPFPITAKQLHYLIEHGYVEYPALTEKEVADKNKINGIARLATLGQAGWFAVNSLARLIQRIGITHGELTTLGFIFCTMATAYFWRKKPADVECPIIIKSETPIAEILVRAGDIARVPFHKTPLDFISPNAWSWSRLWALWRKFLDILGLDYLWFRPLGNPPIKKIPDDECPEVPRGLCNIFGVLSIIYCGIFLAGWNLHFPTETERALWRIASVVQILTVFITSIVDALIRDVPYLREKFAGGKPPQSPDLETPPLEKQSYRERFRTLAAEHNPDLRINLRLAIPVTLCAAIYSFCRAYILIEDCISFRSEPPGIFKTVEWTDFLPHL